jgi:hypothetical protein
MRVAHSVCVTIFAASLLTFGPRLASQSGVVVSYPAALDVVLNEPVIITFKLENQAALPVSTDLGEDRRGNFRILVRRLPAGAAVPIQKLGVQSGVARVGAITVNPGSEYTQQLLLDDWLTFRVPGDYEVDLSLDAPFRFADGAPVSVDSRATLRYRVGPRDQVRLQRVCQRLASAAIVSDNDFEAMSDAARALSRMVDPVAVPCIRDVLQATTRVDFVLMSGLIRVGTEDARRVLVEMSASADAERATLARDALRRFTP